MVQGKKFSDSGLWGCLGIEFEVPDCATLYQVPIYIIAQTLGSVLATYIGQSVYGVQSEVMTTRPLHSCSSAFWVELIATFIIMFLVASLTHHNQSVRLWILQPVRISFNEELQYPSAKFEVLSIFADRPVVWLCRWYSHWTSCVNHRVGKSSINVCNC